jgi:hypothetical protein
VLTYAVVQAKRTEAAAIEQAAAALSGGGREDPQWLQTATLLLPTGPARLPPKVSSPMLAYADACWPMLRYADVC